MSLLVGGQEFQGLYQGRVKGGADNIMLLPPLWGRETGENPGALSPVPMAVLLMELLRFSSSQFLYLKGDEPCRGR